MNHPRLTTDPFALYRHWYSNLHKINPDRAAEIEDLPVGWAEKARLCWFELLPDPDSSNSITDEVARLRHAISRLCDLQAAMGNKIDSALNGNKQPASL